MYVRWKHPDVKPPINVIQGKKIPITEIAGPDITNVNLTLSNAVSEIKEMDLNSCINQKASKAHLWVGAGFFT